MLEPIDSVCMGLAARKLYMVHRSLFGSVPLNVNRGASCVSSLDSNPSLFLPKALRKLSCPKCEGQRCELHHHIKEWIGSGLEYCAVSQVFRPKAPHNAVRWCFRNIPKRTKICGRHDGRRGLKGQALDVAGREQQSTDM